MATTLEGEVARSAAAAGGGAPAVSARGLWREFDDDVVLADVSFELGAGRTLAVLGPNGAGKSTLLRMLATLLRPSGGSLRVLGAELPREAWRARGRIGYLAHGPLLYRDLTAAEALAFHARLHGVADPAARIAELLERVGLAGRSAQLVRTLSAGQLQRLAVCRCLLHDPELLLLDEPYSHLDPDGVATVAPLLADGGGRRTRVVVSHDVERALAGADRALVLSAAGRLAYEGPAAGVAPADVRAVYGGRR